MLLEGHAESNWGLNALMFSQKFQLLCSGLLLAIYSCYMFTMIEPKEIKGVQLDPKIEIWDTYITFAFHGYIFYILFPIIASCQFFMASNLFQELSGWACWATEGGLGETSQKNTTFHHENRWNDRSMLWAKSFVVWRWMEALSLLNWQPRSVCEMWIGAILRYLFLSNLSLLNVNVKSFISSLFDLTETADFKF